MTYEEYTAIAGGEPVPEEEFDFYAKKAEKLIGLYTFGRSRDSEDEAVRYAQAELVRYLYEERVRRGILSEANDGLSVSYDTEENGAREIIRQWLGENGMMYPGVERYAD